MKIKTINNIAKLFNEKFCNTQEEKNIEFGSMDPANIIMYCPKNKIDLDILNKLFETKSQKIPHLDDSKYHHCRFSKVYLKLILKTLIANTIEKDITISVGYNMPLIMQDEDHAFILAPKINSNSPIDEWHDNEITK